MKKLIYLNLIISLLFCSIGYTKDYTPKDIILSYSTRTPKVDIDDAPLDYEYSTTLLSNFYYLKIDYERETYKNHITKKFFEYEFKVTKKPKDNNKTGNKGKANGNDTKWYKQIGYEYKTINKRVRYSKVDAYYPFNRNKIGVAILYEKKRIFPALHYSIKYRNCYISTETNMKNWWLSIDYKQEIPTPIDKVSIVPLIKIESTPQTTFVQAKLAMEIKIHD